MENDEDKAAARSLQAPSDFGTFSIVPTKPNRARNARRLSWGLLVVGVGISVAVAVIAATQTAFISAILALIAGVLQIASVLVTQLGGRPDENLVRHLSRRFVSLGHRMNHAVETAEAAFEVAPRGDETQRYTGRLSVELSYAREALGELIATWRDLNPELFEEKSSGQN